MGDGLGIIIFGAATATAVYLPWPKGAMVDDSLGKYNTKRAPGQTKDMHPPARKRGGAEVHC